MGAMPSEESCLAKTNAFPGVMPWGLATRLGAAAFVGATHGFRLLQEAASSEAPALQQQQTSHANIPQLQTRDA